MGNALERWLPRPLRHRLALSRVTLDPWLAGIDIQLVEDAASALTAARMVHDAYVAQGILEPHATGVHVSWASASPGCWSLLATSRADGRPVATMSLVVDSDAGLPMDKIYGEELAAVRRDGRSLAEVGAFAIVPELRKSGLVYLMVRAIWRLARDLGVDRLAIAVHPNGAHFYRDVLLFDDLGKERTYPDLTERARAVALVTRPGALEHVWPAILARCLRSLPSVPANPVARSLEEDGPASVTRIAARKALLRARPDVLPARPSLASYTSELATA